MDTFRPPDHPNPYGLTDNFDKAIQLSKTASAENDSTRSARHHILACAFSSLIARQIIKKAQVN